MTEHTNNGYKTQSFGIGTRSVHDQYADGKAAKAWSVYVGDQKKRTSFYRDKLIAILREHNVQTVLDVACGTG